MKKLVIVFGIAVCSFSLIASGDIFQELQQTAQEAYRRGLTLSEQGDIEGAAAQFKKAVDLCPDFAQGHRDLAAAYRMLGKNKTAVEEMSKAVALDPEKSSYRLDLGRMCVESQDWEGALAQLERLWALDRGMAKELEDDIVSIRGASTTSYLADGTFVAQDEVNEKKDVAGLFSRGMTLQSEGDNDAAISLLEEAVALGPQTHWPYLALAGLYDSAGQKEKACAVLESFLEDHPPHAQMLHMLGIIYTDLGRDKDAAAVWKKLKQLDEVIYRTRPGLMCGPETR